MALLRLYETVAIWLSLCSVFFSLTHLSMNYYCILQKQVPTLKILQFVFFFLYFLQNNMTSFYSANILNSSYI